ncbi:MAG: ATP-grasp fold amidoligase family protein [Alkaliphilus sp.]
MDYKKIIKNREMRFKILGLLDFLPDKMMLQLQYRIKTGRKLNLELPKRYTEKLQWYKLRYRDPLMTKCSDKFLVRDYVESKGLGGILNNLYAVYEKVDVDEIDFEALPDKFVLKTTNGSGTNIFCKDKSNFSAKKAKQCLKNWLERDNYAFGREWGYKDIVPRTIVEELLEDLSNPFDGINDYKFMCFNGQVRYVVLDIDRHVEHKRNIYDADWNFIDVSTDYPNFNDDVPKPVGFEEMTKVANALAADFPCVRVDLYWLNGKVYFGELTFYPWTGYVQFDPDEFDYILGKEFILPQEEL